MPLRDWMSIEHANMFFPVLTQPMGVQEERTILSTTGAPAEFIDRLVNFATKYRENMSATHAPRSTGSHAPSLGYSSAGGSEGVQRNRKFGTRTLVRIARRIARVPWDVDLYKLITRALLAEFLPTTERMALETILEGAGVTSLQDVVSGSSVLNVDYLD